MKVVTLLAFTLISQAALAGEGRKIDFTTVLSDQENVPFEECVDLTDRECRIKKPLTLGAASLRGLAMPEQNLDPVESNRRGQLAFAIYKSAGAELTSEEITLIKKQLAKVYSPLVTARAFSILDPASTK